MLTHIIYLIRDASDEVLDVSLHTIHVIIGIPMIVTIKLEGLVVESGHLHLVVIPVVPGGDELVHVRVLALLVLPVEDQLRSILVVVRNLEERIGGTHLIFYMIHLWQHVIEFSSSAHHVSRRVELFSGGFYFKEVHEVNDFINSNQFIIISCCCS